MTARELAERLLTHGLPDPPGELVELIRGKRDRIPPVLKTKAIVAGLAWNDGHAYKRVGEVDDAARRAALQVADERSGVFLTEIARQMSASDTLTPRQLEDIKRKRRTIYADELSQADYLDPGRRRREEYSWWRWARAEADLDDAAGWTERPDYEEAWGRFQAWKRTLRGGGASLAAALAGTSRAAAARWLKQHAQAVEDFHTQEYNRVQDAAPYLEQMRQALNSCMPKKTA